LHAFAWLLIIASGPTAADLDHSSTETLQRGEWSQWRGAGRDGRAGSHPWPSSLDEETLVRGWSLTLGESYSGPVVSENRVFVTESIDATLERVSAIDRISGKVLWQRSWEGSITVPFFAKRNGSWIRSTPAYGNGMLYVGGMEDVLVAIDAENGNIKWQRDFPGEWNVDKPTFGFVSSPLIDGEHLYVHAGGSFSKLDANTGTLIWRAMQEDGGMMGGWFSSPILGQINGQELLIVQSRSELAALDKEHGKVLWRREIPSFRGMNILTPTVYQNKVFTSNYRGKSYLFEPKGSELDLVWENKAAAYISTPVVINGHAYMHLQNERIACLDLETGEETWRSGTTFGKYWSMVFQDDTIMALDSAGELLLVAADPKQFQIIDRREVSTSSTWAHLAVVDNQVFVRSIDGLTMYAW